MPKFQVNYEATAFINDRDVLDASLEGAEALALADACRDEGKLPTGVLAVIGARISEDDAQGDADIHCFVCVDLEMEGDSLEAVEKLEPPAALLTRVAELLIATSSVDLEANSWELVDASPAVESDASLNLVPALSA